MLKIYLAGNIAGLHFNEATGWRDAVTCDLMHRFIILNPMRDKDHLRGTVLSFQYDKSFAEKIFKSDTDDVFNADIILTYITRPPIGSSFELGMAWTLGKHIVTVTTPELITHPFISESANFLTTELDKAVNYILKTFTEDDNDFTIDD